MKFVYVLSVFAVLLLSLFPTAVAEDAWTVTVLDQYGDLVRPEGLEPSANFTLQVGVPTTITTSGGRYVVITTSRTNATVPLYRKSLGLFGTDYNGTHSINITLNLKSYEADLNPNGDFLHIWIERTGGSIEVEADNIIVRANFSKLLDDLRRQFFAYLQQSETDTKNELWYMKQAIQQYQKYVLALAALLVFVALFSARDIIRKNQKSHKQAEASRSAFDAWLKAYVTERFSMADKAQESVDKTMEKNGRGS